VSAFLGPIHYRMFNKARAVDDLARSIAALGDAQGWTQDGLARLDATLPRLTGEVTDHIDLAQIHASLNSLVSRSEDALAAACEPLSDHLDEVADYARTLGAEAARTAQLDGTLRSAWSAMDEHWLDGMPCDGYMRLTSNEPDLVAWVINLAPHPAAGYERIRTAWTDGFMDAAGIELASDGAGAYRISKAA
jgi:hypothetical protein